MKLLEMLSSPTGVISDLIEKGAGDGHWVTIRGAHVYVYGGKVIKGPASLRGKDVAEFASNRTVSALVAASQGGASKEQLDTIKAGLESAGGPFKRETRVIPKGKDPSLSSGVPAVARETIPGFRITKNSKSGNYYVKDTNHTVLGIQKTEAMWDAKAKEGWIDEGYTGGGRRGFNAKQRTFKTFKRWISAVRERYTKPQEAQSGLTKRKWSLVKTDEGVKAVQRERITFQSPYKSMSVSNLKSHLAKMVRSEKAMGTPQRDLLHTSMMDDVKRELRSRGVKVK